MRIALYIGIAGVVLAIVYYFYHMSKRKEASQSRSSEMRKARVREMTRAPTVEEKAEMRGRLISKVQAAQNLANARLSIF
jgi:hypothetical protein